MDYKKVILIAFLLRLILASMYDIFVSVGGRDILLPDSKFYSVEGKYITSLLEGYSVASFNKGLVPADHESQKIFLNVLANKKGYFPRLSGEIHLYFYIIGIIYFVFGYFPLGVRIFNIALSISSVYFLFKIAKHKFGDITANLFLLVALFLPTQLGYSITLSKDFIRVFIVSFFLWILYGGLICLKRQENC